MRAEARRSEKLWKDYVRVRKQRWQNMNLPPWLWRFFWPGFGAFVLLTNHKSSAFIIAFLTSWALGRYFFKAGELLRELYFAPPLGLYQFLPIADERVFRIQIGKVMKRSLWSVLDFTVLYSLLARTVGIGPNWLITGFAFAIVQWFFIAGFATCWLAFAAARYWRFLGLLFSGTAIALFAFGKQQPNALNWLADLGFWVPPVGWSLYALGMSPGNTGVVWACVSSGLLLASFPSAYRRLRRNYTLDERILGPSAQVTLMEPQWAQPQRMEEAALGEPTPAIQATELRGELDWAKLGLLERLVALLLNQHERLVAEMLVAARPRWTAGLRQMIVAVAVGTTACLLFPVFRNGAIGFIGVLAVFFLIGNLIGNWPGLRTPLGLGTQSPFFTLYPIGFWSLAKVILKVNLVRFTCLLPVLALAGAVLTARSPWKAEVAVWIGLKVLIVAALLQPALVVAVVSPGTSDTRKARFVLPAILIAVALLGCIVTLFVSGSAAIVAGCALGAGALSCVSLGLYGWMCNRGVFDLVPRKQHRTDRRSKLCSAWSRCRRRATTSETKTG